MRYFKIAIIVLLLLTDVSLFAQELEYNDFDQLKGFIRIKFTENMELQLDNVLTNLSDGKGFIDLQSPGGMVETGIVSLDDLNRKFQAVYMKRVFRPSGKFEDLHRQHGLHLWYKIRVSKEFSIADLTRDYGGLVISQVAEPILKHIQIAAPNDPRYNEQWHYNNTGQTGGTVDADIDLPEAWDIEKGNSNVIVSIHDGGVDWEHEDIANNMWVNFNETPNNSIDDDNNGYIDDIYGFNFVDNLGAIYKDDHGTHVAGTISAETNNGIGVSGIAGGWGNGDGVRLMSMCCFKNQSSDGFDESYIYAADNGSVISQNSWGYTLPGVYEQTVLDAIDYFIAEAGKFPNSPMQGGIVIFAAGNSARDREWYPGYYEPVLAVGGTDHNDEKYTFTNFGAWVDIAAPAVNVLSTVKNNKYDHYSGTSMACPHVSGVAALLVSKFFGKITPDQVCELMVNNTDPLPASFEIGNRVNAYKALMAGLPSEGVVGDVNGDQSANSTDALIILSCDVGLDVSQYCPMDCGDVNDDGVVNSTDALIVLSYDVGLEVPYPVGNAGCPTGVTPCAGCNQ